MFGSGAYICDGIQQREQLYMAVDSAKWNNINSECKYDDGSVGRNRISTVEGKREQLAELYGDYADKYYCERHPCAIGKRAGTSLSGRSGIVHNIEWSREQLWMDGERSNNHWSIDHIERTTVIYKCRSGIGKCSRDNTTGMFETIKRV
jgi:hypothetical protein